MTVFTEGSSIPEKSLNVARKLKATEYVSEYTIVSPTRIHAKIITPQKFDHDFEDLCKVFAEEVDLSWDQDDYESVLVISERD